uniref:Uncharacterized protein LOC105046215 n=1 Tax=Elaeis guineensis var. tenera TaxID=51953 RepID=A0A6I9RGT7_ELAGV|nr:uncharacterized protein LOC105046215 [Elaeis guineensis]
MSNSLFSIKQGEIEILRDFVARFNMATHVVKDVNEDMAISVMKRGMRGSRFSYPLDKTLCQTYTELLERTNKYTCMDEVASNRCQIEVSDNKPENETDDTIKQTMTPEPDLKLTWVLHIDRASNAQCSGAGLILTNFKGVVNEYVLQFNFKASNNQAEYEGLLAGLKIAKELDINSLKVFTDSQLIAGQIKDEFEA